MYNSFQEITKSCTFTFIKFLLLIFLHSLVGLGTQVTGCIVKWNLNWFNQFLSGVGCYTSNRWFRPHSFCYGHLRLYWVRKWYSIFRQARFCLHKTLFMIICSLAEKLRIQFLRCGPHFTWADSQCRRSSWILCNCFDCTFDRFTRNIYCPRDFTKTCTAWWCIKVSVATAWWRWDSKMFRLLWSILQVLLAQNFTVHTISCWSWSICHGQTFQQLNIKVKRKWTGWTEFLQFQYIILSIYLAFHSRHPVCVLIRKSAHKSNFCTYK